MSHCSCSLDKCVNTRKTTLKKSLRHDLNYLRKSNDGQETRLLMVIVLTIFVIISFMAVVIFKKA